MNEAMLREFPIVSSGDAEEAEAVLSGHLTDLRIREIRNPKRFGLRMHGVSLGRSQLMFNEFATDTHIDPGVVDDSIILFIGVGDPSVVQVDRETIVCSEANAAILSPSRKVFIERPANAGAMLIRVSSESNKQRYREDTGRDWSKRMVFGPRADLSKPPWTALKRSIDSLVATLQDDPGVIRNTHFRRGFDDLIVGGLLSLSHSYQDQIARSTESTGHWVVRRAEEFLEAHATETISIPDVLRASGCSRSLLFASFKKHRGHSPMDFLAEQRLIRVRERLLKPTPFDSVTSVAYDCGFTHLGRFAAAYKRKFGESPSQTLKAKSIR